MKLRLLLLSLLVAAVNNAFSAENPSYITTPDGVIIYTDPLVTGTPNAVKLEVVSDNIIRVIAAPTKNIGVINSLVTVYKRRPDLTWNVIPGKTSLTLKTKNLIATVDLKTGTVVFS